jgi:hypothetical protein
MFATDYLPPATLEDTETQRFQLLRTSVVDNLFGSGFAGLCCSIFNTKHQAPSTKHQAPSTRHQEPGTKHFSPNRKPQTPNLSTHQVFPDTVFPKSPIGLSGFYPSIFQRRPVLRDFMLSLRLFTGRKQRLKTRRSIFRTERFGHGNCFQGPGTNK